MTPEMQLLNDVQAAYDRYVDGAEAEGADVGDGLGRRVRRVASAMSTLVGTVSEVNWCVRNGREW